MTSAKSPKILVLCEFFNPELGFQENLLVKYYKKMGHHVTIVTSNYRSVFDYYAGRIDHSIPGSVEDYEGSRVIRLPYRYHIMNRLKCYRGIAPVLEREKPDFIFVSGLTPNFIELADYLKRHPSARMVVNFHGDYSNSGRNWMSLGVLHGIIRKYFLDRVRPYTARYFPVTPGGATFLHEIYKIPRSDIEVLPLGADVDLIDKVRASNPRAAIRAKYGIPENAFVIFTGGKIERRKRLELLMQALDSLGQQDLHVIVAGAYPPDDPDYRPIVEAAAGNTLKRAHFTGWLNAEDMFGHMLASDAAIFPASQSVLWLQAIACGLPLVVGDTGIQDVSYVNTHDNIVVLKGDDLSANGLKATIQTIRNDPQRRRQMTEGAAKVTAETLDWNHLAARTLAFSAV